MQQPPSSHVGSRASEQYSTFLDPLFRATQLQLEIRLQNNHTIRKQNVQFFRGREYLTEESIECKGILKSDRVVLPFLANKI